MKRHTYTGNFGGGVCCIVTVDLEDIEKADGGQLPVHTELIGSLTEDMLPDYLRFKRSALQDIVNRTDIDITDGFIWPDGKQDVVIIQPNGSTV